MVLAWRLALLFVLGLTPSRADDFFVFKQAQDALNIRAWQTALDHFQKISSEYSHMDSVLYWKAFALLRLGNRDEARANLAALRSRFPEAKWGADADALEASFAEKDFVDPDEVTINWAALMSRDAAAAVDKIREMVGRPALPGSKQRALFMLQRSDAPEARQLQEELARDGNPETQAWALPAVAKWDADRAVEIYWTAVPRVKQSLILSLRGAMDGKRVAEIAAREPDERTRSTALRVLTEVSPADAGRLLQSEKSPAIRRTLQLDLASTTSFPKSSLETLQSSSNPEQRKMAVYGVMRSRDPAVIPAIIAVYGAEKDREVRNAIIFGLRERKDLSALTTIGRQETDLTLKRRILESLMESDEYVRQALK